MANRASVEAQAVSAAKSVCEQVAKEFSATAEKLNNQYRDAGNNWSDEKYAQLGNIVGGCSDSLGQARANLDECVKRLSKIESVIAEYENIRL